MSTSIGDRTKKKGAGVGRVRQQLLSDTSTSAFLPILLVTCAITGLLLFQAWQLYKDRRVLADLRANQRPAYVEAQRLQTQLEGVAAGTAELAKQGNANAQLIVEALRSRGITINPDARR
jgi:hypothetical protein